MNILKVNPENQHLIDEHKASADALKHAVQASEAHDALNVTPSEELAEAVLQANRRHMNAHQAVISAAAKQGR